MAVSSYETLRVTSGRIGSCYGCRLFFASRAWFSGLASHLCVSFTIIVVPAVGLDVGKGISSLIVVDLGTDLHSLSLLRPPLDLHSWFGAYELVSHLH
jgi:hypothetical protein